TPGEPFSGKTMLRNGKNDKTKVDTLLTASRTNWAIDYEKVSQKKDISTDRQTSVVNNAGPKKETSTKIMGTFPESENVGARTNI
ncbi:MAG: hypothetical protein KGJ07_08345, partial [Patescibacteria group bacterium]|nr:hypothetical protein [Patescibacteria group bacterium]